MMRGGIRRARTGCARCKERKLKCDETKPRCIRCQKRNTICPGFGQSTSVADSKPIAQAETPTLEDGFATATTQSEGGCDKTELGLSSLKMMAPIHDLGCFGENDIFNFDTPAATSLLDLSWSGVVDPDLNDITPNSFETDTTSVASTGASLLSIHDNSSRLLSDGRLSRYFPVQLSRKSADPTSQDQDQDQDQTNSPGSLSRVMHDYSTLLVEYYFKDVAGIFSCYDSHLNPFRSTVSKVWQTSDPVFYALQSMAAACLSDVVPSLHAVGAKLRHAAMTCIDTDIRDSKVGAGSLLALIMLGLSASWHDPNDLGREQFRHARTIMGALNTGQAPTFLELNNKRNLRFFEEAMIYWEMLLSYVSDDMSVALPPTQGPGLEFDSVRELSFPHPWTGIAREAQVLVFEVGRLVRRERQRIKKRPLFTSLADIDKSYKVINTAEGLALRLRELRLPSEQAIVSPGDSQTPVQHLLTVAELYRLTGLLQLHRVFPDLLSDYGDGDTQLEFDDTGQISADSINRRLTASAVEIVNLLRTIPIESATKCVQPFFFVAVASELRILPAEPFGKVSKAGGPMATGPSAVQVLEARKFVISRLSTFEHVLPAKPVRQMIQIVTLTWEYIDKGMADVYWMDVMTEKGWETTMG
ncbi:hypothetical protein PV04_04761 [Phialophora macrospora]|uniref:Zn(2)-C6 fungal-type domain-containing protein n=1 Tax=Phialophora macrospora TaxID=1851006 RepID=A0A0D2CUJ1_9EURO|nr:hypothetical protein PV04_04761 [Phialophora macrospora]